MLDAFNYQSPDKIPVVYHPSPAGLYIHGQKLLDLFNQYPPDNPVDFNVLPAPPPHTVADNGRYHEIKTDEWGTEWEHLIYGVWGHPRRYPLQSWAAAKEYTFPAPLLIDAAFIAQQRKEHLVFSPITLSLFERLHALRPMEEVLISIASRDPELLLFLDRLVDYWMAAIENMIAAGVEVITFGDDWGTQEAPLISPASFREIFQPRYAALMAPIQQAGRKVFFHCCGFMGYVFDALLELGVDGIWPQIRLFESNPRFLQKASQYRLTLYLHPDRQYLIPRGTPREIDQAIQTYADRYHQQGGGAIFYVEIENDAPFQNVQTLIESIQHWR